jgi:hypothetical protein
VDNRTSLLCQKWLQLLRAAHRNLPSQTLPTIFHIDGTGIATSILKERYSAGDSLALASRQRIDDLAIDYDCDRLSLAEPLGTRIEEAIRCELSPIAA